MGNTTPYHIKISRTLPFLSRKVELTYPIQTNKSGKSASLLKAIIIKNKIIVVSNKRMLPSHKKDIVSNAFFTPLVSIRTVLRPSMTECPYFTDKNIFEKVLAPFSKIPRKELYVKT